MVDLEWNLRYYGSFETPELYIRFMEVSRCP